MSDLIQPTKMSDSFLALLGVDVAADAQKEFLLSKLNNYQKGYETLIDILPKVAKSLSEDYQESDWVFFDVNSDDVSFFAYPKSTSTQDKCYRLLTLGDGFDYVVDDKLFGLLVSLLAFSNCIEYYNESPILHGVFSDFYHKLTMAVFNKAMAAKQVDAQIKEMYAVFERIINNFKY